MYFCIRAGFVTGHALLVCTLLNLIKLNSFKTSDGLGFSEYVTIRSKSIMVCNFTQFDRNEMNSFGFFIVMKSDNFHTSREISALYLLRCLPDIVGVSVVQYTIHEVLSNNPVCWWMQQRLIAI